MNILKLNVQDATVSHDNERPTITLRLEIAFRCEEEIDQFYTAGNLDTTTLKDTVIKAVTDQLQGVSLKK
ncbi:hypothetical protein [Sphingobacterium suaedae]|uniref:Uncharacterized protein n=1 Tax=Sphingobacterium suaedae TaxID=1686402 RepID=A0ABW5KGB5_9SPHI